MLTSPALPVMMGWSPSEPEEHPPNIPCRVPHPIARRAVGRSHRRRALPAAPSRPECAHVRIPAAALTMRWGPLVSSRPSMGEITSPGP